MDESKGGRVKYFKSRMILGLSLFVGIPSWAADPFQVPELSGTACKLWEDSQGVPHIHAEVDLTGIGCLGFLHGRDRAWQMDFFKKTALGRKAEFFGSEALQSDFFIRILDLAGIAKRLYSEMSQKDRDFYRAYAHGVNLGMSAAIKKGVYEFREYGYLPENWQPEDSVVLILLQSLDQTRRSFQVQLDEEGWKDRYPKTAQLLFDQQNQPPGLHEPLPWNTAILKAGEYPKSLSSSQDTTSVSPPKKLDLGSIRAALGLGAGQSSEGFGSNNWVITPSQTRDHSAILANDPHLSLTRPAFWYWAHVNTKNLDVIGATFPGVPMVLSGSNRHVSWGVTNAFMPVARLSLVPESDLKSAQVVRPWIWVKIWKGIKLPFFLKTFRRTPGNLPVLPLPSEAGTAMVLRWTGLDLHGSAISRIVDVLYAKNAAEADRVFAQSSVPTWNFVFADDRGTIGYRVVGRVPRFEKTPPFGIPAESLKEVEESVAFSQPLTSDEMPHALNPARGFLASANNRQWPADSRWSAGSAQASGFRAFRIEELLSQNHRQDLESVRKAQCDVQAVDARFLLPKLLKFTEQHLFKEAYAGEEDEMRRTIAMLKNWNYVMDLGCKPCGVYRRWVDRIYEELNLNATSLYRALQTPDLIASSTSEASLLVLQAVVVKGLSLAIRDLSVPKAPLPSWGEIHKTTFRHLATTHPAGLHLPKHHVVSTIGDDFTVNPGTSKWNGRVFEHTAGASQRLVVLMSTPPQVYSVLAGSNLDEEDPQIQDQDSDWQRWTRCDLQRRNFPVDWAKVTTASSIQL